LFRLAEWHTLAKLRLHTETTLNRLELVTTILGKELRCFSSVTCQSFSTEELPKEVAARGRRESRENAKATAIPTSTQTDTSNVPVTTSANLPTQTTESDADIAKKKKKKKSFNLSTYKIHALGDYVHMIRLYGTTDSYNSQTVTCFIFFLCLLI